jgi:hypothetical protein
MFDHGKIARTLAVAACATVLAAGCSGDDETPDPPDGGFTVTTMRGALLQAADVGPTWQPPGESTDPNRLVALCGGAATVPPLPPGAEVVSTPLVDEGNDGAQTLNQVALVYPEDSAARAAVASLRAVADGCPATVDQPATVNNDRSEPAYTETARTVDMNEGGWTGFVVTRHKAYEPTHPGTADTAIAVVNRANVVVFDAYAVYRIGNASAAPTFDTDWKKLVGTVLNRVG